MKVKLIVEGGKMAPGPAVAQQLGPLGINIGKVISDVNAATSGFKGTKVPVELDIDAGTKTYEISVFSPPVAELIKKELGLEKGSGTPGTMKVANASIETLIGIAKTKMSDLLARDLKAALKLVVGTCVSLGVLVDSKEPSEVESEIAEGKYDSEIKSEKTEPSEDKKRDLDNYFRIRKAQQDKDQKALEEAKAAEEAAKEEKKAAAAAAPAPKADAKASDKKK